MFDMMHANSTINMINKPTRFPRGRQRGDPSLLDHFYTNNTNSVTNIGLFSHSLSDHLPFVATISLHPKKPKPEFINPFIRDFRNFDQEKFNESLDRFVVNESDSLDVNFYNLHNHFNNCVNLHIPLRKRTAKEKKFATKPWISNSLKRFV